MCVNYLPKSSCVCSLLLVDHKYRFTPDQMKLAHMPSPIRFASLFLFRFVSLIVFMDKRLFEIYVFKIHFHIWLILFCYSLAQLKSMEIYEGREPVYFNNNRSFYHNGVRYRAIKVMSPSIALSYDPAGARWWTTQTVPLHPLSLKEI